MKATLKTPQLTIELEGDDQKDLFRAVADAQEIFSEPNCGKCKSTNIQFRVRNVEDNEFFEIVCRDCGAKLAFGQNKKGGRLFPIRKITADGKASRAEGTYDKESRGWVKWKGSYESREDSPPAQPSPAKSSSTTKKAGKGEAEGVTF